MKIVAIPDSFKSTLSAAEVAVCYEQGIKEIFPGCEVVKLPAADGGEGTTDAVLASMHGRRVPVSVSGPDFACLNSYYAITENNTAVIEMANAAGLMLMKTLDPSAATTLGVGQMIMHALEGGIRKFLLFIGGSATNDAGMGLMHALGMRFFDADGKDVFPVGGALAGIEKICDRQLDPRLYDCVFDVACDVDNPLFGENGAAYVFAPQKGADRDMVARLDGGLKNIAELLSAKSGGDIGSVPGMGAAGGFAAGLYTYFNVNMRPGIEFVLDAIGFDQAAEGASLVITGEGKTDSQTLNGKVPLGVARRCQKAGVECIVISGSAVPSVERELYECGVKAVFSSVYEARDFSEIKPMCSGWIIATVRNVMRMVK